MEVIAFNNQFNNNIGEIEPPEITEEDVVIEALSKKLANELRKAKKMHLECGEVLLPTDLTRSLAMDVYKLAEMEPYGLKGCTIFINFEDIQNKKRVLSILKCDPTIPSTFEVYLTLKQTVNGWNSFIPQFFKKMTKGGTVMISSEYDLEKKKLYRSYDD